MRKRASRNRKSSQGTRMIFDAIRKPAAPPGHPLTNAKPDEKARPAGRKAKHKRKPEIIVDTEDTV